MLLSDINLLKEMYRKKYKYIKIASVLIVMFFVTFKVPAAVEVEASSRIGAFENITGVSNLTWQHTVGSGLSRALFVGVSTSVTTILGTASARVSGVTYSGLALTRVGTQVSPLPGSNNAIEIFRLVDPPSGPADIIVSIIPSTANYAFGSAVSFTGVDQTTPERAFFSNLGTGDTPTVTVTDSLTGDIVFDTVSSSFNASSFLVGSGQSVCFPTVEETDCRRGRSFFGNFSDVGASSTEPAASPVTMDWTLANSNDWALGAIAIKALGTTAAAGSIEGRVLSKDGRGIPRVIITLSSGSGISKSVLTNPFGFYRFGELEIGGTFVLQARSKQFTFAPLLLTLDQSNSRLDIFPIAK